MSQLAKEKTEIPCPGGGKEIKTTYGGRNFLYKKVPIL